MPTTSLSLKHIWWMGPPLPPMFFTSLQKWMHTCQDSDFIQIVWTEEPILKLLECYQYNSQCERSNFDPPDDKTGKQNTLRAFREIMRQDTGTEIYSVLIDLSRIPFLYPEYESTCGNWCYVLAVSFQDYLVHTLSKLWDGCLSDFAKTTCVKFLTTAHSYQMYYHTKDTFMSSFIIARFGGVYTDLDVMPTWGSARAWWAKVFPSMQYFDKCIAKTNELEIVCYKQIKSDGPISTGTSDVQVWIQPKTNNFLQTRSEKVLEALPGVDDVQSKLKKYAQFRQSIVDYNYSSKINQILEQHITHEGFFDRDMRYCVDQIKNNIAMTLIMPGEPLEQWLARVCIDFLGKAVDQNLIATEIACTELHAYLFPHFHVRQHIEFANSCIYQLKSYQSYFSQQSSLESGSMNTLYKIISLLFGKKFIIISHRNAKYVEFWKKDLCKIFAPQPQYQLTTLVPHWAQTHMHKNLGLNFVAKHIRQNHSPREVLAALTTTVPTFASDRKMPSRATNSKLLMWPIQTSQKWEKILQSRNPNQIIALQNISSTNVLSIKSTGCYICGAAIEMGICISCRTEQ